MSRVTASASRIARSITTSSAPNAVRSAGSPLHDTTAHHAGAVLLPKYAELLSNRTSDHLDSTRGIRTAHRPTPQPSIANRSKPTMQTFHSSPSSAAPPTSHIDASVLPSTEQFSTEESSHGFMPRMPLLPDSYATAHEPLPNAIDQISAAPAVSILAADPEMVAPARPFSGVQGYGLDTLDLNFAHQESSAESKQDEEGGSMLKDIWTGFVDDVFGPKKAL